MEESKSFCQEKSQENGETAHALQLHSGNDKDGKGINDNYGYNLFGEPIEFKNSNEKSEKMKSAKMKGLGDMETMSVRILWRQVKR